MKRPPRRAVTPSERFRARPGPRPRPNPLRDYGSLGAPPEDPLEAYVWALEALQTSLYHVMNDSELNERERRKEMREISRAMATLEPKARLFDAEERIRGDNERLEEDAAGPEMEDDDATELAPETYRAKAKRGRPSR